MRRIWISSGAALALLAGTAILVPMNMALFAAAPVLAGWLLLVAPQLKPFMPAIEAVDLGVIVRELGHEYAPRAYISEETYRVSRLVHGFFDGYAGGHLIEATLGDKVVRISKLRVTRREPDLLGPDEVAASDARPPGLPRFFVVFTGLFYEIEQAESIEGHVVVLPRGAPGDSGRPTPEGVQVKLDDFAFDSVYAVWASDPALARTLLTPGRRTALLTLVLASERPAELAFVDDRVYVALPGSRAFIESVQVRSEADPPATDIIRQELRAILALPGQLELV